MNNINESVEIVMNMLHIRPTGYPILDIEREALQTLIDFVKRVESAEMPEKKEHEREFCGGHQSEAGCTCGALQFNEAIDVCKLFLAKMNKDKVVMKVKDLKGFPKKKEGMRKMYDRDGFEINANEAFNHALDKVGELDVKIDKDKEGI